MVIPTWILLLYSTRKISDESFELLELGGDELGANLALQAGVEGIFADGEGLVEDTLAGHASSGVQGAFWVGECLHVRVGARVRVIVRAVPDDGTIPGYELATDNNQHELDLAGRDAGALEHLRHEPDDVTVGREHGIGLARLAACR